MKTVAKISEGGIIVKSLPLGENSEGIFMTQHEMLEKIEQQKKVIDHLSRVIQNKNKKYRRLEVLKMPHTLYGREVIIVPDSMAKQIMLVNRGFYNFKK